jgi:hypothetical protein
MVVHQNTMIRFVISIKCLHAHAEEVGPLTGACVE